MSFWNFLKDANGDWAAEEMFALPSVMIGEAMYLWRHWTDFDILTFMGGISAAVTVLAAAKRIRGDATIDKARLSNGNSRTA